MGSMIGKVYVDIRAKYKGMKTGMDKARKYVDRSVKDMDAGIQRLTFNSIKYGSMAAFGAFTVGAYKAIGAASDLEEVQSKFNVVFKGQEADANKWSKNLVDSYAMSTRESKQYLSSVQDLLVPMGMNATAAGVMSSEIVKLSADLGSFNNLPTAQVMENIQSALTGEYESMKKYGVVVTATTVQQKAMLMGLADKKDKLTAADKALAAYTLMVEGSTAAIGDMARTADGFANQQKKATANVEDFLAMAGNRLLPIASHIVGTFNDWYQSNQGLIEQNLPDYIANLTVTAGYAVEAVRFLHNGFNGLKLGGQYAVEAIALGFKVVFDILRKVLLPLDLVMDGLVKLGKLDVNPLDGMETAFADFRSSSKQTRIEVIKDIEKTNEGYDKTKKFLGGINKKIQDMPKVVAESSKKETKIVAETADFKKEKLDEILKSHKDNRDEAVETTAATLKKELDAYEEMYDATGVMSDEHYSLLVNNLEKERDSFIETTGNKELAAASFNAKLAELDDSRLEKVKEANTAVKDVYRELYGDLGEQDQDYFNSQFSLLGNQKSEYEKILKANNVNHELSLKDRLALDEWYENEWEKIQDSQTLTSNDFFAGMSLGWESATDDMKTWAETGQDIAKDFANDVSTTLSDYLFDGITGGFDGLSGAFQGVADNMGKSLLGQFSSGIVNKSMSGLGSIFGGMMGGSGGGGLLANMAYGGGALGTVLSGIGTVMPWIGGALAIGSGLGLFDDNTEQWHRVKSTGDATFDMSKGFENFTATGRLHGKKEDDVTEYLHQYVSGMSQQVAAGISALPIEVAREAEKYLATNGMDMDWSRLKEDEPGAGFEEIVKKWEKAMSNRLGEHFDAALIAAAETAYGLTDELATVVTEGSMDELYAYLDYMNATATASAQTIGAAFNTALEANDFSTFGQSVREQIYTSVKDGMMTAMLESELFRMTLQPIFAGITDSFSSSMVDGVFDMAMFSELVDPYLNQVGDAVDTLEEPFNLVTNTLSDMQNTIFGVDSGLSGLSGAIENLTNSVNEAAEVQNNIVVNVGNEQLDAHITEVADEVIVNTAARQIEGGVS